jgi:membrane-associated phospholipid phosphatase
LHFIGHGRYDERAQEGMLLVEGSDGRSAAVSSHKFGALLHDHQTLRLVVLNACEGGRTSSVDAYGGVAQALLRSQIPAVIAMQAEISDGAATTFAREFYSALADGCAVDAALGEARKALFTETESLEWGTPVLYTSSADNLLFELAPAVENGSTVPLTPPQASVALPGCEPMVDEAVELLPRGGVLPPPQTAERDLGISSPNERVERGGRFVTPVAMPATNTVDAGRPTYSVAAGWMLLGTVFLVNLAQTALEPPTVTPIGLLTANAMHWLERGYRFENPEAASIISIRGYSLAYFFLFPIMAMAVGVVLARARQPEHFRRLALALTFDYLLSLPFFLLFPVPERWAYPESNAILLSDLWSSALIEAFRPASALDNCFPSFHTSMTVVIVLCCYLARVRFRTTAIPIGAMVLVSTFALGIHWMGDVLAGTAVGIISVALACRMVPNRPPEAQVVLASRETRQRQTMGTRAEALPA